MQSITLTWVPSSNSVSQEIEFKRTVDSTWTLSEVVGPLVATATIAGLDDDTEYKVRINNIGAGSCAGYSSEYTITTDPPIVPCDPPTSLVAVLAGA